LANGAFMNNKLTQRPFSAYYGPRCLFWEWYVLRPFPLLIIDYLISCHRLQQYGFFEHPLVSRQDRTLWKHSAADKWDFPHCYVLWCEAYDGSENREFCFCVHSFEFSSNQVGTNLLTRCLIQSYDFWHTLYGARNEIPLAYFLIYGVGNVSLQSLNWFWYVAVYICGTIQADYSIYRFSKMISALRKRFDSSPGEVSKAHKATPSVYLNGHHANGNGHHK